MNSLPTIERKNQEQFLLMLQKADPDLFMIKTALKETSVDPRVLVDIVRSIANISYGTGYGKLQIFMQARVITQLKGEESVEINRDALVSKRD